MHRYAEHVGQASMWGVPLWKKYLHIARHAKFGAFQMGLLDFMQTVLSV